MNEFVEKLETERLELVAPALNFAADVHSYSRDERFCAFIDAVPTKSVDDATKFLQHLIIENSTGNRCYWVILERTSKLAIGTLGFLFPFAKRHRVAEFGYGISPAAWGSGMFQEAAQAVLNFGFTNLRLQRIQAYTRADNTAAIKSVKKIGFEEEGRLKSFYQTEIGSVDAIILANIRNSSL